MKQEETSRNFILDFFHEKTVTWENHQRSFKQYQLFWFSGPNNKYLSHDIIPLNQRQYVLLSSLKYLSHDTVPLSQRRQVLFSCLIAKTMYLMTLSLWAKDDLSFFPLWFSLHKMYDVGPRGFSPHIERGEEFYPSSQNKVTELSVSMLFYKQ